MSILNSLTQLLLNSAKIEKQVEIIRQLLCEFDNFHPYNAFKKLDSINENNKSFIDVNDICTFMELNGFFHSLDECRVFIDNYGQDSHGTLQYSDFLRAILPSQNNQLRQTITIQQPKDTGFDPQLQYILAKLISTEILLTIDSDYFKKDLHHAEGFSYHQCFQMISPNKILIADLNDFFRRQSILIYDDEIQAIMRRMDYNCDGQVDEQEFQRFVSISNSQKPMPIQFPIHRKNLTQMSTTRIKTPEKNYLSVKQDKNSTASKKEDETMSNILTHSKANFNVKLLSTMSQSPSKIKTPQKYIQQKADLRAELATFKMSSKKSSERKLLKEKKLNRSLNLSKKMLTHPTSALIDLLLALIENEAKLEILKIQLAKQSEFNLFDAFRAIDVSRVGYVTAQDLQFFLNITNQFSSFVHKYGSNSKIRYIFRPIKTIIAFPISSN